jgi:hypothetical protein
VAKILEATCTGGVVKVGAIVIDDAVILSKGLGDSEGVLLIEEFQSTYIPSQASDLEDTLTQLIAALEKVADAVTKTSTTFTSVGAGMTGPTTAPPPTLAVDVALLVTYATAITAAKTQLETLKGVLK